nr:hypothetical protein [Tanacetum cinerariifolium]
MPILRGRKSIPRMNSSEREMERGYYSDFTNFPRLVYLYVLLINVVHDYRLVIHGHTRSWKEMRIRSLDRLPGFPSGFPLGMVPPKNLDERNSLVPHDSILTIQNSL